LIGARLLLVEDNEVNQMVAAGMLRLEGFVVDVVGNGAEALEQVVQNDYDAVLMDVQMPVMDGLEATRAIRRLPKGLRLPIIALTANAMLEDRQVCLDAGMNDYVSKPIAPDALAQVLGRWLEPRHGTTVNGSAVSACLREIETLLSGGDIRVLDVIDANVSLLKPAVGADFLRLDHAIRSFDHESALGIARAVLQRIR
jgi:CheY-like chemotaxis protein